MKPIIPFSLALLSLSLVPLHAYSAEPTYEIKKQPLQPSLFRILRIEVIGTAYQDAVTLALLTRPGDEVSREQLEADRNRIHTLGWFSEVVPRLQPVSGGYHLLFYVRENPTLERVKLLNPSAELSESALETAFEPQLGRILNYQDLRQQLDTLVKDYQQKGQVLASLTPTPYSSEELLSPDGTLYLEFHEGRIEDIRVTGNKETKPHVILREMSLKSGDIFERQRFEQDLARVFNTNYFESITPQVKPGQKDPHAFILEIDVQEKQTGDVGLNFGLNNRDGLVGGVRYTKDNFLGEGRRLNADVRVGLNPFGLAQGAQLPVMGRVDFFDPWLLPDRTAFGASLYSERVPLLFGSNLDTASELNLKDGGLIQRRTGVSLSLGRPLFGDFTSPWRGSLSLRAEQVGVNNLDGTPRPDLTYGKRFSATDSQYSLGGSLAFDTRNYLLNPTAGLYGNVAAEPVWGDGGYLRFSGNLSTYLTPVNWLTLALGIQGGAFLGQNPAYEQFIAAGPTAIRGWQENGGLFGKQFWVGSLEARFPIFKPVSGVLFTDIGEFFAAGNPTMGLNQGLPFKYGVGAGLRMETPLGLLRLDYGVRDFSNLGFSSLLEAGQLHFSVGHKF
jgi:outer membrane protein insertion porin family